MKSYRPDRAEALGSRLALPVAFIGSMFALAFLLYAIDATPLRMLMLSP